MTRPNALIFTRHAIERFKERIGDRKGHGMVDEMATARLVSNLRRVNKRLARGRFNERIDREDSFLVETTNAFVVLKETTEHRTQINEGNVDAYLVLTFIPKRDGPEDTVLTSYMDVPTNVLFDYIIIGKMEYRHASDRHVIITTARNHHLERDGRASHAYHTARFIGH